MPTKETLIDLGKRAIVKLWRSILPKLSDKENVIQYVIRQFLICDSSGNPSVTTTIIYVVMGLILYVAFINSQVALNMETVIDPETHKVVGQKMQGFSSEFMYLIISLSVVITGLYNARQKRINNSSDNTDNTSEGPSTEEPKEGVIDKISNVVNKITG